ncbi:hypothetical protein [Subtercola boreus]|uniref:Uncharacterized protein n=1 Tax=Subtercola boreus TaxID=120213 RepID=A0A3E0WDP2_9MICO|nr:hypothetical protein [Subtercola boreus]RFA23339.1 hypothetical protein B7R24_00030 [Subtercola boreus]RFA23732.1 hypothetical protein B7R23_00030 [Subtercola boreus]RFA29432.1 hypothetical protein B7R25_00025 [Subtercola boreus]
MSGHAALPKNKRRRFAPVALGAGVLGAVLLSLSLTGTMSGFVASITNSQNTAATGALVMQEQNSGATVTCLSTDGGSVSTNASTCATINKFGGSTTMTPGNTVTTPITIKNIGTVAATTFTLTPGATCTQTNVGTQNGTATDLCAKMNIVITSGATTVFSGTLASLAGAAPAAFTMPSAPAAGVLVPFSFAVTLASTAGNTYQGLQASLPLTWTFGS